MLNINRQTDASLMTDSSRNMLRNGFLLLMFWPDRNHCLYNVKVRIARLLTRQQNALGIYIYTAYSSDTFWNRKQYLMYSRLNPANLPIICSVPRVLRVRWSLYRHLALSFLLDQQLTLPTTGTGLLLVMNTSYTFNTSTPIVARWISHTSIRCHPLSLL